MVTHGMNSIQNGLWDSYFINTIDFQYHPLLPSGTHSEFMKKCSIPQLQPCREIEAAFLDAFFSFELRDLKTGMKLNDASKGSHMLPL